MKCLDVCFSSRVKNLQFALTVEPKNARVQQKLTWANSQRQAGLLVIPSTIEEEMEQIHLCELIYQNFSGASVVTCQSPVENKVDE
ncbi:hypothetical protein CRYUN_Cryun09bG0126300 [Craigia yunnanensis]